jgi:hypothetical protein
MLCHWLNRHLRADFMTEIPAARRRPASQRDFKTGSLT